MFGDQHVEAELLQDPVHRRCLEDIVRIAGKGTVTLLYAAKDREHNHAVVLLEVLKRLS